MKSGWWTEAKNIEEKIWTQACGMQKQQLVGALGLLWKRVDKINTPAKKWGDTEIAERGRSVLVMRARYRSAELTPHQRGWTDAG